MFRRASTWTPSAAGQYWLPFLVTFFAFGGLIAALSLAFLLGVWVTGHLDTSGRHLNWEVVGALAGVAAAIGTAGAVATLRFAVAELETQTRDERITRKPYLRVDVGFREEIGRHPGFQPGPAPHFFSPTDFNMTDRVRTLSVLAPQTSAAGEEESFGLCLWVRNVQQAALGIAYNVKVELVAGWPEGDSVNAAEIDVEFAYVEPGKTTAIELCRVRRSIEWLAISVDAVSYEDIFPGPQLADRHGALEMFYDRNGRVIWNDRKYRIGKQR